MLTSWLYVGLSAVKSTSMIVVPFASSMSACAQIISVGASSSSMFPGVVLLVHSDPARSQKEMSLGGSACVAVEVDGPVSGFFFVVYAHILPLDQRYI